MTDKTAVINRISEREQCAPALCTKFTRMITFGVSVTKSLPSGSVLCYYGTGGEAGQAIEGERDLSSERDMFAVIIRAITPVIDDMQTAVSTLDREFGDEDDEHT